MGYWDCPKCAAENSLDAVSCWRCGFQNFGGVEGAAPPRERHQQPADIARKQRRGIQEDMRKRLDAALDRSRAALDRLAGGSHASVMSTSEFVIDTDPTPSDVQYLEDRLYEFNSSATGITDGEYLAILVRDEDDRIVAGICGNTWGGCCEIRQFWVDAARRRRGLGTRLFRAAEQEARRRGCTQIVLMTFSFQAPVFYVNHGFEVVATVDGHPRGHRNLLMRKRLDQPAAAAGEGGA
jgi:GNAT superfamily N-acetyltransferase